MNRILLLCFACVVVLGSIQNAQAQKKEVPTDSLNPKPGHALTNAIDSQIGFDYSSITPLSPTAASLGSYGEVPVSLYSGTPNINIPLTTLSGVELKVPLSLSYRAAGIRVEENASWVGLGWSLEAGGVITRNIRGKEDRVAESSGMIPFRLGLPLLSATQAQQKATFNKLQDYNNGNSNYDFEPDVFNYNFMGLSGSFVFDSNGQPKFSNYSNYKVVFTSKNPGDASIPSTFTLTTDNGTIYEFNEVESTLTSGLGVSGGITAWYLTRVSSATGKEVIDFTYSPEGYVYHTPPRYAKMISPNGTTQNSPYVQPSCRASMQYRICNTVSLNGKRLNRITFQGVGIVDFVASATDRLDLGLLGTVNNPRYLDELLIKDVAGTVKKRFDFDYEYVETFSPYTGINGTSGCPTPGASTNYLNQRLYLKSLKDKSSADVTQQQTYKFTYSDRTFNGKDGLPHKLSAAQDHWGFFNNKLTNEDLWPGFCGPFGTADDYFVPQIVCSPGAGVTAMEEWHVTGADRNPSFPYMRYSTLQSIQYPTSGITEFTFEPNTYDYIGKDYIRPTLPTCAPAESLTMAGGLRIKEINSKIDGTAVRSKEYSYSYGVLRAQPFYYSYFYAEGCNNFIYANCNQESSNADFRIYAEVNCGPVNDVGYRYGSHIGYKEVIEREFSGTGNAKTYNGSTIYTYRTERDIQEPTGPSSGDVRSYIFSKDGGQVVDHYREHPILSQYLFPYFPGRNIDWATGQLLTKTAKNSADQTVYKQENTYTNDFLNGVPAAKAYTLRKDLDYIYVNYNFIEGWPKLTQQVETTYDVNGQNDVTSTKNFYYASANHKYLTSETFTGSDNAQVETEHRYIEDYSNSAMAGVIGTLKSKRILNKEVDVRQKKRDLTVKGSVTEYNADGQPSAMYALETAIPISVGFNSSASVPASSYIKKQEFSYADKRLQTVTLYDGAPKTYLWAYSSMRLVAEIKNATYADVVGTGENLTELSNPGATDGNIRTVLQNIRVKLPNALMKSYTHDLIYGVSSTTEPNGITNYFIYDALGRLSLIKNTKQQTVKSYQYNNKQP
ncbi:hypothetical protein IC229_33895 [Spirosoma sp. BT702]|uniref:YD repeat-containing protein n=1 Tax=Spirosoma profusum TaxID=2771354 RepID=A0A927AWC2_9BACT|nr:hypothetical protein [Spirosoma profusum]MBD2705650.1 hypothetical protein [Spirosoma profusum]